MQVAVAVNRRKFGNTARNGDKKIELSDAKSQIGLVIVVNVYSEHAKSTQLQLFM